MAHNFSNEEYMDMVLTYGEVRQNSVAAASLYALRFPQRYHPGREAFLRVVQRGRETGNLRPRPGQHGGAVRPRHILNMEEEILNIVEEQPGISTRTIAAQFRISQSTVWRTLRHALLYPFHVQRVQALLPRDLPVRVNFCEFLLHQHQLNPNFTMNILVTDEAIFTRNGIHNFRNTHYWALENPHATRRTNFQQRFSVNVWAGIVNGVLIGPFILENRLTGALYLQFLRDTLPVLLEEVAVNIRQHMWFLHDGAPVHFQQQVRQHLDNVFPGRWIGRGGPIAWPPRSPDLNPLDFYFWGHIKTMVYVTEVNTKEELVNRIHAAAATIRQQPGLGRACGGQWIRRAEKCIENGGNNFEQLM